VDLFFLFFTDPFHRFTFTKKLKYMRGAIFYNAYTQGMASKAQMCSYKLRAFENCWDKSAKVPKMVQKLQ
jgi:hypothetical protein